MTLSNERIQETKNILEKKGNRKYSWNEASEIDHRLEKLVVMLLDKWEEDKKSSRVSHLSHSDPDPQS